MSGISVFGESFYSNDLDWGNQPTVFDDVAVEEELVGAHLPSTLLAIEASDGVIELEIGFLVKCPYFVTLLDQHDWSSNCHPQANVMSMQVFKVLMAWGEGDLRADFVPWSDLEVLVKASDYLGLVDLLDQIAVAQIIPRIYGEWYDIRARLLFTYEKCQPDPDNWEFDPIMELDFKNFILHYYTQDSIEKICARLSRDDLNNFILSLGDHVCKFSLNNKNFYVHVF